MMKNITLFILFSVGIPFSLHASCIIKNVVVYSEELNEDFNEKGEHYTFYPKIHDFEHEFPSSVRLTGQLKGDCKQYTMDVSINFKTQSSMKKGGDFLQKAAFQKTFAAKDFLEKHNTFSLKNIPHEKFYQQDPWYSQVKYTLRLKRKGKEVGKRTLILSSPLIK